MEMHFQAFVLIFMESYLLDNVYDRFKHQNPA